MANRAKDPWGGGYLARHRRGKVRGDRPAQCRVLRPGDFLAGSAFTSAAGPPASSQQPPGSESLVPASVINSSRG
jgi:hypothetical protein